jgi:hypothetical protein
VLLDAFARGGSRDLEELEQLQAHFLTCSYCGELLRTAEDLRARNNRKDQPQPRCDLSAPMDDGSANSTSEMW